LCEQVLFCPTPKKHTQIVSFLNHVLRIVDRKEMAVASNQTASSSDNTNESRAHNVLNSTLEYEI